MRRNVILDLEFCSINKRGSKGLKYMNNEVIQFGAVMLDDKMQVVGEFMCYVKPEYTTITKSITNLTGITTENLEDAPCFAKALNQFLSWIEDDIENTYIYSWSDSDEKQIRDEAREKCIIDFRLDAVLSHWHNFQREFGVKIGYSGQPISLSNALSCVDFLFEGKQHSAIDDARNTAKLFALCEDREKFEKKTKAIRSCFIEDERSKVTIGDLLGRELEMFICC